jgi:hypothetical protein
MKKFLAAICLLMVTAGLFYHSHYRSALSGFNCSGLIVFRAMTPEGRFTYTAEAKMFFTNPHEGFYVLNGSFSHNEQTYNLHRTTFFTYQHKNDWDLYEITITRQRLSNLDNAPQSATDAILLPVGDTVLPLFRRIDDRTIIISTIYSPFFICAKESSTH